MKNINLPTDEQCYKIMDDYEMFPNIKDHSIQVRDVSIKIYNNLKDKTKLNKNLISSSALLHDIAKTRTIKTGELRHDLLGGNILREIGYEKLIPIVESHVFFENFKIDGPLEEREIVFYADKRVLHDTIVSVNDRIDDLVIRYGKTEHIKQIIRDNKSFVLTMEKKIQSFMKITIEDAIKHLDKYIS